MIDFTLEEILDLARQAELQRRVEAEGIVILQPESDHDFRPRVIAAATGLLKEEALTASAYRLDAIGDRYGVYRKGIQGSAKS